MAEIDIVVPTTPVELAEPFHERIEDTYNTQQFIECATTIDELNTYSDDLELRDEYMVRSQVAYRIGKFTVEGGSATDDRGVERNLIFCGEFMAYKVVRISDILIGAASRYTIRAFCLQFDTEAMNELFVPLRSIEKIRRAA